MTQPAAARTCSRTLLVAHYRGRGTSSRDTSSSSCATCAAVGVPLGGAPSAAPEPEPELESPTRVSSFVTVASSAAPPLPLPLPAPPPEEASPELNREDMLRPRDARGEKTSWIAPATASPRPAGGVAWRGKRQQRGRRAAGPPPRQLPRLVPLPRPVPGRPVPRRQQWEVSCPRSAVQAAAAPAPALLPPPRRAEQDQVPRESPQAQLTSQAQVSVEPLLVQHPRALQLRASTATHSLQPRAQSKDSAQRWAGRWTRCRRAVSLGSSP